MSNGLRKILNQGINLIGDIPVNESVMVNLTNTKGYGSLTTKLDSGALTRLDRHGGGVAVSYTSPSRKSTVQAGQGVVAGDGIGAKFRINF